MGPGSGTVRTSPLSHPSPSQVRQRMAHGWFSWWICGIPMWQQPNGRPWISSLLRDDETHFPCWSRRQWLQVNLGRLGYSPAPPVRAVIPCSETCLARKFLFGVLRSRGVPLSFGYCKWAIFSLYLLRVFFSSPSSHLLLRFFSA